MKQFVGLILIIALTVIASLLPFTLSKGVNAYTRPGYNGKVLFHSYRDGDGEIYVMDADGSNQTNLTNHPSFDGNHKWSSDGAKIVFYSNRETHNQIYVMDADGSNQTRLTNSTGGNESPVWSPDGSKIAFTSFRDGNSEIYIMDADGDNQIRLTNHVMGNSLPVWSPDGSKIAFWSSRDGDNEIYAMDADGDNQIRLTNSPGMDLSPVWSPDGSKIAFTSFRDGNSEIYIMDADGSNPTRLTSNTNDDISPVISPNGTRIAHIQYTPDFEYILVVMDIDGSNQQEYDFNAEGIVALELPIWSPDGTKITFTGYHAGWSTNDQYLIDANGTNLINLSNDGTSSDGWWQPILNTSPLTTNDSATISFNTPTLVNVLTNDTDEETLDGQYLSVFIQPSHGSASIVGGQLRYAPNTDYQGSDSLTYQTCDSFLLDQKCATGTLTLTVQAPVAPSVSLTNVNGEHYSPSTNRYTTSSLRPTFSGAATSGAEITVEIHSDPIILTTTADGNGNWSVAPTFDLPSGEHIVYVSATLNGLTTELDGFALGITPGLADTGESVWVAVVGGTGMTIAGVWMLRRLRVEVVT